MLMDKGNLHGGDRYGRALHIDFSANVNPFGTPASVKRAVAEALDTLSFYPDAYCRALRFALSDYEEVPYEHILCGNGAAELIYSFAYAVAGRRRDGSLLSAARGKRLLSRRRFSFSD